jgi:hypothetical protein
LRAAKNILATTDHIEVRKMLWPTAKPHGALRAVTSLSKQDTMIESFDGYENDDD